jgi:hypothetical protein
MACDAVVTLTSGDCAQGYPSAGLTIPSIGPRGVSSFGTIGAETLKFDLVTFNEAGNTLLSQAAGTP